jgi:iron complex outermembrane receptor protein
MKNLFILLFSLSLFYIADSQVKIRPTVSGKITDTKTGEPLAGASVTIEDAKLGTVTDSTGRYFLRNVPVGHHLIEVSFTGYSSVLEHLDIVADKELNISLTSSIIEYQAVTVTGVSTSTSIRKTPVPITIVRKDELLQTPSTNIIDALSKQAGISQVGTGPAISKPVIRGLGFNRVVVINDGIRQEGQQWGEEHGIEIDESSVNRVEILKGPASLMYGSDALAGVINIISNVPVAEGTVKGNVLGNYQTNNHLYTTHAGIGGNQNGFGWNVYGSLRSAGDYKNEFDGKVLNSPFNEKNYGAFVGLNKSWGYSRLVWNSFNQDLGVIEGERDELTGKFLVFAGTPEERIATDNDLQSRKPLPPFQKVNHNKFILDNNFNIDNSRLKIILGYQDNKRKEFAEVEEQQQNNPELFFDLKTTIYNVHWVLPEKNKWRTTIGFNGLSQHNENRGKEEIIPDYRFSDAGLFIYSQGFFNNYTLSGGFRFDNRSIDSKEEIDNGTTKFEAFKKSFSNFSGGIGISYEPSQTVTLKANIGRGFRAPNLAELASNGAHEGTNRWEYGSKNLKSEQSLQLDGEVDLNNEHLTLGMNVFYNHINNFIFYRRLNSVFGGDSIVVDDNGEELQSFQFDQSNARLYGFEINLDLHPHPLDWLHFENKLSFVRGKFNNNIFESDNLPQIPAPRWLSELRADFKKAGKNFRNFYIMMEADNNLKQENAFYSYNTETATPAYTLLNVGVGTDLANKNKTVFSVHLSVNNITDKAYQNHLTRLKYTAMNAMTGRPGVFNMGRNFSIKLNVPFSFSTR